MLTVCLKSRNVALSFKYLTMGSQSAQRFVITELPYPILFSEQTRSLLQMEKQFRACPKHTRILTWKSSTTMCYKQFSTFPNGLNAALWTNKQRESHGL
jgi:hypothetical protein